MERKLYEQFFQRSRSYYLNKVDSYNSGRKITFNLAPFIFGFSWFIYRKMYLEAGIVFAILILQVIIEEALLSSTLNTIIQKSISSCISIIIWAATGFLGNYLYISKAKRIIAQTADLPEIEQEKILSKKGGVSLLIPIVLIGAYILLALFVNYI